LLRGWNSLSGRINGLIPLMLIVVTIETEQFPIASVGRIILMVVVLMMDGELAEFLAVKFAPAVGADPGEELERLFARGLFPLRPVVLCHARLEVNRDLINIYSTARRERNPVSVARRGRR